MNARRSFFGEGRNGLRWSIVCLLVVGGILWLLLDQEQWARWLRLWTHLWYQWGITTFLATMGGTTLSSRRQIHPRWMMQATRGNLLITALLCVLFHLQMRFYAGTDITCALTLIAVSLSTRKPDLPPPTDERRPPC
jgi:hypothetical protein